MIGQETDTNSYIYGGGLFTGTAYQRVQTGEGLVSESVKNDLPVIYVAMNYRLNSKEHSKVHANN